MPEKKYFRGSGYSLHRMGNTLDKYASKTGEYATHLIIGSEWYKHLRENLLTEEGFAVLSSRIKVVEDNTTAERENLISCSGAKGSYCYNTDEFIINEDAVILDENRVVNGTGSHTADPIFSHYGIAEK